MYKLLHWLFGWEYIHWHNTASEGISRVFALPDGKIAYWRYRNMPILDIIEKPNQVAWLTCSSKKYFPDEEMGH